MSAVGEVYEDRHKPGRRAKIEGRAAYGWAAMRTTEHPNPRAVGRLFYTTTATLTRRWVQVDTTEESK